MPTTKTKAQLLAENEAMKVLLQSHGGILINDVVVHGGTVTVSDDVCAAVLQIAKTLEVAAQALDPEKYAMKNGIHLENIDTRHIPNGG